MNNFKLKKNDLLIEGVSVKKLSKKFETPFYCYSSSTIIEKFKEFEKPFKYSGTIICYAVKANPNIAILKILSKLGAGAEVVSKGELKRSLKANIPAKKIVFSGVGKSLKEIEFAIKKNILQINVESEEELKLIENIAKKLNLYTIGLTGMNDSFLKSSCDIALTIPSQDTQRIQEGHILVGHLICEIIENYYIDDKEE